MAPPSRQERLQMRQRGAGARKVDNVDFGFSFGLTPRRVHQSAKRTSKVSHADIRHSSNTPSQNGRQSSARRSVRSASVTIDTEANEANNSTGFAEDRVAHTKEPVSKRRKTTNGHISQSTTTPNREPSFSPSSAMDPKGFSFRNSKSHRRTFGPTFVQIAGDPVDEVVSEKPAQNSDIVKEPARRLSEPELKIANIDKENAVPDEYVGKDNSLTVGKSTRKIKKRRSIGQQSRRRKKRSSKESVQSVTEDALPVDSDSRPFEEEQELESVIGNESSLLPEQSSKLSVQTDHVSKKRRRRRSVVFKPRKKKRSGEFSNQRTGSPAELPQDASSDVQGTTEQVLPAEPPPQANSSGSTGRRVSDASDIQTPGNEAAYDVEIEGDETYIDEVVSPEKRTPKMPPKRGKARRKKGGPLRRDVQKTSSHQAESSSHSKKSSKTTFPILTHRMANISALPTVDEEAEGDTDTTGVSDSLKTKFIYRSAPNAIDVLAQICRETISTTISKLLAGSSAIGGRDLKRKRTALENFGTEIDSRLFDMSVALEHRLTMEARVKKATKAKTGAQNEWLEIRRQRQDIALKCDEVRARNSKVEAERKEVYELSEQLHELEMVLEKPELDEDGGASDSLDYMLKSTAKAVSCAAADDGGLLNRVKEFNRQLERTALVLEGRELD